MSNSLAFKDFYQVPDLNFDINKLRNDLTKILKKSKYQTLGITNFAAIPMNKIPGDDSSIQGHNVRGLYWTKPDETGREVARDKPIDETKYTELTEDFKNTYFEEVYNALRNKFKIGRIRLLLKEPRSTLSWHKDPEPRLHIPIITNPGCKMVIEDVAKHMPADGKVWITNNTRYHNFFNGGEQNRIHIVACMLENRFN